MRARPRDLTLWAVGALAGWEAEEALVGGRVRGSLRGKTHGP